MNKKPIVQIALGLILIIIGVILPVIGDGDATAALVFIPTGAYLMITKQNFIIGVSGKEKKYQNEDLSKGQ